MPPSRKTKKLKKTAAESGEDRIGALSDQLAHRVLSFLPAHEAVRTCVLSRRWRELWKSMRTLRVTEARSWGWINPAKLNKFVNHLLFFRDLAPVDVFEFTTYQQRPRSKQPPDFDSRVESIRYVKMWIRYALIREVRVLRVLVDSMEPQLLLNASLISQHLTTLELAYVVLDGCAMDFSSCPLLDDLQIRDSQISVHKMLSHSLRRLCISECYLPVPDDTRTRLQIFAPNLHAFRLINNFGGTPFLGSMPLLVTAFVMLLQRYNYVCWKNNIGNCGLDTCTENYSHGDSNEKCVLLGGLSNAMNLELEAEFDVTIFKQDLKWCPTFSKLKTLTLNGWIVGLAGCNFHGLICFLQHAPILEKLTLHIYNEHRHRLEMEESSSLVEQCIPSEHLKIVEIRFSDLVEYVQKLVETLITCGIPPDIINIRRK